MMLTFLTTSTLMMSIMFIFMKHPLSFGIILLAQTILSALLTGITALSFWYSYILFIIMVGGMMVLFIYMTSVASNEKFKFSLPSAIIIVWLVIMNIMFNITDKFLFNVNSKNMELMSKMNNSLSDESLLKFTNWPASSNLFAIIAYLFITLIVVVKITDIQHGPLRQKF
uniref:NADH-ubiquinone oxidoreductase chain 6 n=1 Tax=Papunya picta TaxID=2546579 RepID=A0A6H0N1Q6_9CUCU|nr:NADH dehydrogenase subunit 6 [Papunya picta]